MTKFGTWTLLAFACALLVGGEARAQSSIIGDLKRSTKQAKKKTGPAGAAAATAKPGTGTAPAADAPFDAAVFTIKLNDLKEDIVIKLNPAAAPKTVANFRKNIEEGFYNGLAFHRVVRNYLIQTGDPTSRDDSTRDTWGTTDNGQPVPGEFVGNHKRYAVAMAHKAGDTTSSGSQFYIMLRDDANLDKKYAVFGEVIAGKEILNKMSGVLVDTNDTPARRIEVVEAKIVDGATALAFQTTGPGRRKTIPESQKTMVDKIMERVW